MVRSAALTGYEQLVREFGIDPEPLLQAVGLPAAALREPDLRIPVSGLRRLLELSAGAAGIEDFGVRLAETRDPSNLGLLAVVAREARTLRDGIASLGRYMRLHNEALSLRMEPLGQGWLVTVERHGPAMRQVVEMSVTVLHRTLSGLFGTDWRPELVCFAHPAPRDTSVYRRVFGVRVQFGSTVNGLVCANAAMNRRRTVSASESLLARDAKAYLERQLEQLRVPFLGRVREIVSLSLSGDCSVERVAALIGIDRRTLHRRLARSGQTYTKILDDVRLDAARTLIAEEQRPLQEVATLLGFGSPSTLSRWFHKRMGSTPTEWRRRKGK
jgi:AraC-like DNA-binding protein